MSLYLCIFADDDDTEVDGVELGAYSDFGRFRDTIARELERGRWGSRFPIFMNHRDSDGVWRWSDAQQLESEMRQIADELSRREPIEFADGWQASVFGVDGRQPANLNQSFTDVDGQCLTERIAYLAALAARMRLDIWFQ